MRTGGRTALLLAVLILLADREADVPAGGRALLEQRPCAAMTIADGLRERGYQLVTVEELLARYGVDPRPGVCYRSGRAEKKQPAELPQTAFLQMEITSCRRAP